MRAFDWEAKGVSWTRQPFTVAIQEQSCRDAVGQAAAEGNEVRREQDRNLPQAGPQRRGDGVQAPL